MTQAEEQGGDRTGRRPASVDSGASAPALTEEDLRLPSAPGVIRRFWARHPWWTDSLVASAYLLPTLLFSFTIATVQDTSWIYGVMRVVLIAGITAALLFRRRKPVLVFAIAIGGDLFSYPTGGQGDSIPTIIALYSLAVYVGVRKAWIGFGIAVAATFLWSWLWYGGIIEPLPGWPSPTNTQINWFSAGLQYSIVLLAAVLIGINVGNRKRYLSALVERAAQLARERDQQAQISAGAERARIAREMHDVIAHSLSVVVALADGAVASAENNPRGSKDAMQRVADTGRDALAEMRKLLGVLREDQGDATLAPQPTVSEIGVLVEGFRAAGLPVNYETSGAPSGSTSFQLVLYRLVQEALTNALRYSRQPSRVDVALRFTADAVVVDVVDDGRGAGSGGRGSRSERRTEPLGSGRGLAGMAERVKLYGGTLTAGPAIEAVSGWRVHAELPAERVAETGQGEVLDPPRTALGPAPSSAQPPAQPPARSPISAPEGER